LKVKKMSWRNVAEISKEVYWIGIRDWNRRLFDALIPLPRGTTYNSYLVIGSAKKAVIDTVNPGFEKEWEEKISKVVNPADIDYVIMNHAEPDHAGSIPHMMSINSKAMLVTTGQGAKMARVFYKVPENRIKAVVNGDSLDLGGKTLRFIEAPMLHWPETIFTYLPENKTLFPCDFFGSHVAQGLFDDEIEDLPRDQNDCTEPRAHTQKPTTDSVCLPKMGKRRN
jgi:flavorubredoxin